MDDDWTDIVSPVIPVGRLRMEAHDLFDPLWKNYITDRKGRLTRQRCYYLLASEMGVPEPEAHFGQMDHAALSKAFPAIRRLRQRFGLPV